MMWSIVESSSRGLKREWTPLLHLRADKLGFRDKVLGVMLLPALVNTPFLAEGLEYWWDQDS